MKKDNRQGYILIADGGSSKVEWALINPSGNNICSFTTHGMNPAILSDEELGEDLHRVQSELTPYPTPDAIFYYGAGCATPQICDRMRLSLLKIWDTAATIEVNSDMLGACHAACGDKSGIAAILGTGSNSAHYDGEKIIQNIPPLGFILGDEGGGGAIGKAFFNCIYKDSDYKDIREIYERESGLSMNDIIAHVYRMPQPNKFLASVLPFIKSHIDRLDALVEECFRQFISRNIRQYDIAGSESEIHFIGSVAYHFQDQLRKVVEQEGYHMGKILQLPMPGLIKYHVNHMNS